MIIYIPVSFCDEDYTPSWTGNNAYATVTIRGIFDSKELAMRAIKNWQCADDCNILVREIENKNAKCFRIDYEDGCFSVWEDKYGGYGLNEVVDEEYSAVWDEFQQLGVTDY